MPGEGLDFVYTFEAMPIADVWARVLGCLRSLGRCPDALEVGGKYELVEDIAAILSRRGKSHFTVEGAGWSIGYGVIQNYDHSVLQIQSSDSLGIPRWHDAAAHLVNDRLITGRAIDLEYEHWQNAHDPLEYRAAGRSHEHLPHVSNGLPYPLTQEIIDTSENPGRRVIRDGFVEAVGAIMWLGPLFFTRAHCDIASLRHALGDRVKQSRSGIVEVIVQGTCFASSEGDERDRQMALRRALFGAA